MDPLVLRCLDDADNLIGTLSLSREDASRSALLRGFMEERLMDVPLVLPNNVAFEGVALVLQGVDHGASLSQLIVAASFLSVDLDDCNPAALEMVLGDDVARLVLLSDVLLSDEALDLLCNRAPAPGAEEGGAHGRDEDGWSDPCRGMKDAACLLPASTGFLLRVERAIWLLLEERGPGAWDVAWRWAPHMAVHYLGFRLYLMSEADKMPLADTAWLLCARCPGWPWPPGLCRRPSVLFKDTFLRRYRRVLPPEVVEQMERVPSVDVCLEAVSAELEVARLAMPSERGHAVLLLTPTPLPVAHDMAVWLWTPTAEHAGLRIEVEGGLLRGPGVDALGGLPRAPALDALVALPPGVGCRLTVWVLRGEGVVRSVEVEARPRTGRHLVACVSCPALFGGLQDDDRVCLRVAVRFCKRA
jgi:hypothetical protein